MSPFPGGFSHFLLLKRGNREKFLFFDPREHKVIVEEIFFRGLLALSPSRTPPEQKTRSEKGEEHSRPLDEEDTVKSCDGVKSSYSSLHSNGSKVFFSYKQRWPIHRTRHFKEAHKVRGMFDPAGVI